MAIKFEKWRSESKGFTG